jgi:hypothetical protein
VIASLPFPEDGLDGQLSSMTGMPDSNAACTAITTIIIKPKMTFAIQ